MLAGGTDVALWVTKQHRDLHDDPLRRQCRRVEGSRESPTQGSTSAPPSSLTDAYDRDRRALSRARRALSPLRVAADPQRRHAGRQHRQRLADRRLDAGADRDRHDARAAQAASARASCRSTSSISRTRRRRSSPASSSSASAFRPHRAGAHRALPTRFPSGSTRTSPRCAARFRIVIERRRIARRADRLRRRRGDTRSGRRAASERSPGAPWNEAHASAAAMAALDRRLRAAHRHARQRRVPHEASPRNLLYRFCLETSGRQARRPRSSNSRCEPGGDCAMDRHPPAASAPRFPTTAAHLHVSGEAIYTDDIPKSRGTLHAAIGMSERAHARIKSIDLDQGPRGARRRRRAHREGHSGQERLRPRRRRRPDLRDHARPVPRPVDFRGCRARTVSRHAGPRGSPSSNTRT